MNPFKPLFLTFLICLPVTTICQVPAIISQPGTVYACEGDSVTLEVITDQTCSYQWFTAYYSQGEFTDFTELTGENSNKLILNSVSDSINQDPMFYFLRIIHQEDTLWSQEIRLAITSIPKAIEDTVFVNDATGGLRIPQSVFYAGWQSIWSTGDTSKYPTEITYIVFDHLGKNWIKVIEMGCSRTDTFQVAVRPRVMHINKSEKSHQYWNADTVYIEKDVFMGGITILPGTLLKFKGDYLLNADYIDAISFPEDTIGIQGNVDTVLHKNQGCIYAYRAYVSGTDEGNSINNIRVRNMNGVVLSNPYNTTFYNNDSVVLCFPGNCVIRNNKKVMLKCNVNNSYLFENDSIFGICDVCSRRYAFLFESSNNIFSSNNTGIMLQGRPGSEARVHNNIFENNRSTAITAHVSDTYIDQNIFKGNSSLAGPSILEAFFDHVDVNPNRNSYYEWVKLHFRNNTTFNNSGKSELAISINDTLLALSGTIINNIFWNRSTEASLNIGIYDSHCGRIKILNNSLRDTEISLVLPADSNVHITGNLFKTYPEFRDTLNSNLTLKENSPLIDAGIDPWSVDYYDKLYDTDFIGVPRKIGTAIDIGVFEYQKTAPITFSYLTPDTLICNDDYSSLKAFPPSEYINEQYKCIWYKNGVVISDHLQNRYSLNISGLINPAGIYSVALTNFEDTLWSEPIVVSHEYIPLIDEQPLSKAACSGTGVEFQINTKRSPVPNYSWHSIKKGLLASGSNTCYLNPVNESDTLYVIASNRCGSTTSDPIRLLVYPAPVPDLGKDTTIYEADSLLLKAGIEFSSYVWNSGEQEQQLYAHAGDTVWITVTDFHNCIGSDTLIVYSKPFINNTSDEKIEEFTVFPNPAKDRLFIKAYSPLSIPSHILIFSLAGSQMRETKNYNQECQEIDISGLTPGVYFIRIQSSSQTETQKFIVK